MTECGFGWSRRDRLKRLKLSIKKAFLIFGAPGVFVCILVHVRFTHHVLEWANVLSPLEDVCVKTYFCLIHTDGSEGPVVNGVCKHVHWWTFMGSDSAVTVGHVVMNISELWSGSCQNTLVTVFFKVLQVLVDVDACCCGCGSVDHFTSAAPSFWALMHL